LILVTIRKISGIVSLQKAVGPNEAVPGMAILMGSNFSKMRPLRIGLKEF